MSKIFPTEERFVLTTRIIRSSRGVYSAIAEAYRKRNYEKHFKSEEVGKLLNYMINNPGKFGV